MPPEVLSFLLFCALSLSAIALFPGSYLFFIGLVAADGFATLANGDTAVAVVRSAFFLALLDLSVLAGPHSILFIFLVMILAIAVLDVSFLLRRLRGTLVDASVITGRLRSYAYTLLPAFLLSYVLTYAYSLALGFVSAEPVVLLAVSSTVALLVVYAVSRHLSPRVAPRR